MGTTLTGTTPQDTYDSLIKVTDNGPLSGTLKALSDGLGNDSALALSTTAASITGSLTTTAKTLAERVQVGTAATLNDATGVGNTLQFANYSPSVFVTASADSYIYKNSNAFGGLTSQSLVFQTRSDTTGGGFAFVAGGTPAVVATITSAGDVGIGTTAPTQKLTVNGNAAVGGQQAFWLRDDDGFSANAARRAWAITANYSSFGTFSIYGASAVDSDPLAGTNFLEITPTGVLSLNQGQIKFPTTQVASADANTLDDYEEGTFTPSLAFGGGSTGITYFDRVANYTKIGRQVYVQMYVALTNKGTDTGNATITGLPFTVGSLNRGSVGAIALDFADITFTGQMGGQAGQSATQITLTNTSEAGSRAVMTNSNFNNASQFWLNITYNA